MPFVAVVSAVACVPALVGVPAAVGVPSVVGVHAVACITAVELHEWLGPQFRAIFSSMKGTEQDTIVSLP
jgi:hypothetical protein